MSDLAFILGGVDAGNVPKKTPVTCKKCQKKFGIDLPQQAPRKRKIRIVRRRKIA